MKLLLDENLSRRLVPMLEAHYPGTTQVALERLQQAVDLEIWQFAKEQDYVILTRDSDYYDLSMIRGAPPKVIWLQIGNCSKDVIADLLIRKKTDIYDLLADKNIITLY